MSRTLVTGGAGFTGRYLVRLLAERGEEVHAIARTPESDIPGAAGIHVAELTDLEALREIVAAVRPTRVAHLAAIAFVAHADVADMYRSNILGTRQLLQALAEVGTAEVVLLASSANVYGNERSGTLTEDLAWSPVNDYGVTKVALEMLAGVYASRLRMTVVRPFNYTGRGQGTDFLIPKIVEHARRRADVIELGNLDVARDFSDIRMVVDTYGRLLDKFVGPGPFNICSGKATTLRELLSLVEQVSGHHLDCRVNPAFVRPDEVRVLVGSSARIESAIGPLGHIPLAETLKWMLD